MTRPGTPFPILAMKTVFVLLLLLTAAAMATAQIPHFSTVMSETDYNSLYSRDIFSDVYLPAPFSTVDSTWNDAQLRFKGHSTRYYPKKSFRIRFATTHLFDQMRQFNLNAMYTDKSFLREKLAWDLYADIGALAPAAFHATFAMNGNPKGLYLWLDKVDRYFLQRRDRIVGPLYDTDEVFTLSDLTVQPDSLLRIYYPKEVGDAADYSDLRAMIEAINLAPDSLFASVVASLFDVTSIYNWLLINTITMMGDTYNKNYLLYRDTSRATQQWTLIPWDYDLSFGRTGDPSIPYPGSLLNDGFAYTFPPLSGPSNVLKDRFWNTPALREGLRSRLDTILRTVFTEERIHPHIDSLAALIEPEVARDPQRWGSEQEFRDHVEALKFYVTARRNFLRSTFIQDPTGSYNLATLHASTPGVWQHCVAYDGRQIASLRFAESNGLDSVTIQTFPDSMPPAVTDPARGGFIRRWVRITPHPATATFKATLQWSYYDVYLADREVAAGVQDERLLRPFLYDGSAWKQLAGRVNPVANFCLVDSIDQSMCGDGAYFALLLPDSYIRTWYRFPASYWQRWHDIVFANAQTGYIIGEHGSLLRTSDAGTTWSESAIGFNAPFFSLALQGAGRSVAAGEFGSLYRTTDGGATWQSLSSGTTHNLRSVIFSGPDTGWAVGDGGVLLRSVDGGTSWTSSSLDSSVGLNAVVAIGPQRLVAGGDNGVVYLSSDGGLTWHPTATGTNRTVLALAVAGTASLWAAGEGGTVLRSTDSGTSWSVMALPTSTSFRDIAAVDNNHLYVAGDRGTVYYTPDGGGTWFGQYTASSSDLFGIAFTDSTHGYAVGSGGTILSTAAPGTVTSAGQNITQIPSRFRLFQNYPNPFNPATAIQFALPSMARVTVRVYTILGQEVATLVDETLSAGGHIATWDAKARASGLYFCRITAEGIDRRWSETGTVKMLLVR